MPAGASVAFALLRVPRGQTRPTEEQFRAALTQDRERLHQPAPPAPTDVQIGGPYPITVDGAELDEYVVWER
jgi:hypothetical protein